LQGCECVEFSGLGGGELGLGVRVLWSAKIMPPLWRRFCNHHILGRGVGIDNAGGGSW